MPIATTEIVLEYSFITENVEEQKIRKAIILAEDRHIKPFFGLDMYNDIIANSASYTAIADNLNKSIAWYVTLELADHIYSQIYNTGVVQGSTEFGATSVANIVREKQADARQRGSEYLKDVYATMKDNQGGYPLFDFNSCESKDNSYQRNGGIMMDRKRINKDRDILNITRDSY